LLKHVKMIDVVDFIMEIHFIVFLFITPSFFCHQLFSLDFTYF